MPKCEFKATGGLRSTFVDGTELVFNGDTAEKTLSPGEHPVQWFARGNEGQEFLIEVVRPESAKREVKGTLGPSRKDAGTFWIEV